ncbi:FecCD family ABC transporter permease [Curvivirga sp.]|uniref:FecCD family ABC transporter permease n=1 Tax=Curvivirga sp. TaxID=2856848 RepID=UPI003B5B5A80
MNFDNADTQSLSTLYRSFIWKRILLLGSFLFVLMLALIVNIMAGPAGLSLSEIWSGLTATNTTENYYALIMWEIRLPYVVMAMLVGACLGLAGAEMQTVLNNPLASPSTLGVMYGATLGASLAIVYKIGVGYIPENYILPICAFLGAMITVLLIQFLSAKFGATIDTVILFGIAMVFALQALIALVQFVADSDNLQQIVFWTMGSLARANWEKNAIVLVVLLGCIPFTIRHLWQMTALRAGEEYAKSYGLSVERLRLMVLFRVSIVTAAAVSFTGIIGFVGLVAPHISRMAFGEDHRFYIPGSIIAGAFILVGASILSKTLIPGILIPDGIVTALIGIPLFLFLLIRQKGAN